VTSALEAEPDVRPSPPCLVGGCGLPGGAVDLGGIRRSGLVVEQRRVAVRGGFDGVGELFRRDWVAPIRRWGVDSDPLLLDLASRRSSQVRRNDTQGHAQNTAMIALEARKEFHANPRDRVCKPYAL
jgi:hypothetical protein